jgi:hypothetical protein
MKRILGLCALALLVPVAATAQHPQARQGLGISFGLGGSFAYVTCDGCEQFGGTGPSGYLRLGGYVSPSFFVAAESNGSWSTEAWQVRIGSIMGVVQWYPMVDKGIYLKGGLGYSQVQQSIDILDGTDLSTSGLGVSIGAGYDWRVARNFALTPYVNYLTQLGGTISDGGFSTTDVPAKVHVVQFGLGFTWF